MKQIFSQTLYFFLFSPNSLNYLRGEELLRICVPRVGSDKQQSEWCFGKNFVKANIVEGVLDEIQCGFRPLRGCQDQISTSGRLSKSFTKRIRIFTHAL